MNDQTISLDSLQRLLAEANQAGIPEEIHHYEQLVHDRREKDRLDGERLRDLHRAYADRTEAESAIKKLESDLAAAHERLTSATLDIERQEAHQDLIAELAECTDSEAPNPCPQCGGVLVCLGTLANTRWFRCRNCGWEHPFNPCN